jgi:hypothetical protein
MLRMLGHVTQNHAMVSRVHPLPLLPVRTEKIHVDKSVEDLVEVC